MITYLFMLLIVGLVSFPIRRSQRVWFVTIILTVFLVMVALGSLRNQTVGTDSWSYVLYFYRMETIADVLQNGEKTLEYGFWALVWLARRISDEYVASFALISITVVGCYLKAIVENSNKIPLSLFLFITMGFYVFHFNGARQGIACAICSLALTPLINRNLLRYLAIIGVAATFHKSAIVMLPVYFFFFRKNNWKFNGMVGIVGLTLAIYVQDLVVFTSQFDERYASYAEGGKGGAGLIVLFYLAQALIFVVNKKLIRRGKVRYNIFLNMLIFSNIISLVSVLLNLNPSGIIRIALYFNIVVIFLWPILFSNLRDEELRKYTLGALIITLVIFFTLTTSRFGNLTPYKFNWEANFKELLDNKIV